jgi:hypothetical protein
MLRRTFLDFPRQVAARNNVTHFRIQVQRRNSLTALPEEACALIGEPTVRLSSLGSNATLLIGICLWHIIVGEKL